jgi:hypothetical protein
MTSIPTSLRIAIGFILALWIVGLTALAFGAPGHIIVATAVIGTVGAVVEWTAHRSRDPVESMGRTDGCDGSASANTRPMRGADLR